MQLSPEQSCKIAMDRSAVLVRKRKRSQEMQLGSPDKHKLPLPRTFLARIIVNRAEALRRRRCEEAYQYKSETKQLQALGNHLVIPEAPLGWVVGEVPVEPQDFGQGFVLPSHCPRLLQVLHPHGRDIHLEFIAAGHVYLIRGVPSHGSVTGLVQKFAHQFNPDEAIRKMMGGRNWPRPQYMHDNGHKCFYGNHQ